MLCLHRKNTFFFMDSMTSWTSPDVSKLQMLIMSCSFAMTSRGSGISGWTNVRSSPSMTKAQENSPCLRYKISATSSLSRTSAHTTPSKTPSKAKGKQAVMMDSKGNNHIQICQSALYDTILKWNPTLNFMLQIILAFLI